MELTWAKLHLLDNDQLAAVVLPGDVQLCPAADQRRGNAAQGFFRVYAPSAGDVRDDKQHVAQLPLDPICLRAQSYANWSKG